MKKIGILYICTGPYIVFWDEFFKTFEEKFLLNTEKHYYIFTDNPDGIALRNERVHVNFLQNQPWPLITLLRFQTFLSIKDELADMDYLMFMNSNASCDEIIDESEVLPREELGERLVFATHPGYENAKKYYTPLDRNPKSFAYVPYNCGGTYVIGALYLGETKAFLEMSELLRDRVNEDLKHGVIARWHDESHVNRYILGKNVRILSPSYVYPWRMNVTYPKKMSAVSKIDKFDIDTFKGANKEAPKKDLKYIMSKLIKKELIGFLWDSLCNKKVAEIK